MLKKVLGYVHNCPYMSILSIIHLREKNNFQWRDVSGLVDDVSALVDDPGEIWDPYGGFLKGGVPQNGSMDGL